MLNQLKLTLHPDKTFIGKIAKSFDFLGYHFTQEKLTLAKVTLEKALSRLTQLFEQGLHKLPMRLLATVYPIDFAAQSHWMGKKSPIMCFSVYMNTRLS